MEHRRHRVQGRARAPGRGLPRLAQGAQLQRLDDPQLHRALGDAVAPALAEFDGGSVDAFYRRVGGAIREAGHSHIILRENTYLSNMGVPSLAPLPADLDPVASSPHAYDLVVDTPAVTMASDQRVRTILERHAELQQRWQRPALLGGMGRAEHLRRRGRPRARHPGLRRRAPVEPDLLVLGAGLRRDRRAALAGAAPRARRRRHRRSDRPRRLERRVHHQPGRRRPRRRPSVLRPRGRRRHLPAEPGSGRVVVRG